MLRYFETLPVILGIQSLIYPHAGVHESNIVDLGYARYQGVYNSVTNITSFRGIRYAAPPTGSLRWQAPQVPENIPGIQPAINQAIQCFQGSIGLRESLIETIPIPHAAAMQSEDCLFLNVFTPGPVPAKASLPVVVWLHPGGYVADYLETTAGDGGDFIRNANGGVISVVIQYRLGLFGFLSSVEVKKNGALNAGLLDQRFALQWVQKHISSFGGDPTKVSIWGGSAGAGSVIQHVVSNGGNADPPLFRAAITSSTFLPPQYNYDSPIHEKLYTEIVTMTNCSTSVDSLACLREADASALQAANLNISLSAFIGTYLFVPVVDGDYIVERPVETLRKGKHNGDTLLAVTNSFEGRVFVHPPTTANLRSFVANVFPNFGELQINSTISVYDGVQNLPTDLDRAIAIMGESIFICPSYFLLEAFSSKGYKGEFAVPPANHGADIGQFFPSTLAPVTKNRTFIASFAQSFLAVALSLDPNAKFDAADITPSWEAWSEKKTEMLFTVTEEDIAVIHPIATDEGLKERCSFWQGMASYTPQ